LKLPILTAAPPYETSTRRFRHRAEVSLNAITPSADNTPPLRLNLIRCPLNASALDLFMPTTTSPFGSADPDAASKRSTGSKPSSAG